MKILMPLFALCFAFAFAQDPDPAADPEKVDADYAVQGEYQGKVGDSRIGTQVIALGDGKFRAVGYIGGLPGDGWDPEEEKELTDGQRAEDGSVTFKGENHTGILRDGKMVVMKGEKVIGELMRVERKSPSLGKKPPEGAVVLFDGGDLTHWRKGTKKTEQGLLMQGANSEYTYQDGQLHLEFRLPYLPKKRGQGRGNSGCYLQARYEVQVLDSFGLEGKHNECGGVYSVKDPDLNMCFPPLVWQTYDIDFTAAKFEDGKKVKSARMTVRHNGVVVHDDIEVPKRTTASPLGEGAEPGYLHLQNHGNPVRYQNIWFVPGK